MPKPTVIPLQPIQPPTSESALRGTPLKHVVESQQFTVPLLMELFERSRGMEHVVARGGTLDYQNRIMTALFYAPSTRTRARFLPRSKVSRWRTPSASSAVIRM
jgi:hypothetical protein